MQISLMQNSTNVRLGKKILKYLLNVNLFRYNANEKHCKNILSAKIMQVPDVSLLLNFCHSTSQNLNHDKGLDQILSLIFYLVCWVKFHSRMAL